jgi:HD-GYP domain-containing protein (c-di-GMP phosphodiesterase class II)
VATRPWTNEPLPERSREPRPQARVVELVGERDDDTLATLGVLSEAVEETDSYTAEHGEDVAELSVRVGRRVGLRGADLRALHHTALMHDVGKVGVPAEILLKPAPLTSEERREMERHTVIGARILSRSPTLEDIAPLVRATHERWDGEGYPDGLAGEDIPLAARVVAACDAYDAITTERPYREARTHEDALGELRAGSGSQFDPWVVVELIAELRKRHS